MTDSSPMPSGCPEENALVRFAVGAAPPAEADALEVHLDACTACRRAVATAAATRQLPALPPPRWVPAGTRIGRYEVEKELGAGGMGIVYSARDVTLDRRVALKLMHDPGDESARARLVREAQVMARLAHPNVVPVFELGEWQGAAFLAMEQVEGETLDLWLKAQPRDPAEVLARFQEAGRGLWAAHQSGVVHRDFKPANVLVGADGRARVTDFGLARAGGAVKASADPERRPVDPGVTREGAIAGTPAYMAPEQRRGQVDERSDQYAFCLALGEALGGRRIEPLATGEAHGTEGRPSVRLPRTVPPRVRRVLERGLAEDPARRFASMDALLSALAGASARAGRFGLSAGASRAVAAVAALVVLLGAAVVAVRARVPEAPPSAPVTTASASPDAELVSVVVATAEIAEGTVLTMDLLSQRAFSRYVVTSSYVKPETVAYAIGHRILVPVQKGDAVLWSQLESERVSGSPQGRPPPSR